MFIGMFLLALFTKQTTESVQYVVLDLGGVTDRGVMQTTFLFVIIYDWFNH